MDDLLDEAFNDLFMPTLSSINKSKLVRDWQNPLSISSDLLPVMSFHDDLLPEPMLNYVKNEASTMPCSPEFVAVSLIAAACITIGTRVGIKPKQFDDWMTVAPSCGVVVAPPSHKKSPSIGKGMKPLEHLIQREYAKYEKNMTEYRHVLFVHETQVNTLKAQLKKAEKNGDFHLVEQIAQDIATTQEYAPLQPKRKRLKINDATSQAILKLELDNPNGIIAVYDELLGLFARLDKTGNEAERIMFLQGWNGLDPYEIDRVGMGHFVIPRHCVVFFGGIQPDSLCKYLDSAMNQCRNDGLFQRVQLMVYPDPELWCYRDIKVDLTVQNRINDLFERMNDLSIDDLIRMGAFPADDLSSIPYFRFAEEAQTFFIDWMTRLHTVTLKEQVHPILIQHFCKYDKLMPSLALMFHIVECLTTGYNGSVSLRSAKYAADWCTFLESHAKRIYGMVLNQNLNPAAKLTNMLKKLITDDPQHTWVKDGFTVRQIQQKGWSGLNDHQIIKNALEMLEDHHWLKGKQDQNRIKGGRPSTRYWINPKLYEKSPTV